MKLIIFGYPGSGKGVYSTSLVKHYGLTKISTGDIFRDEIKKGTELGKRVEGILKSGQLVPNEVVNEVFKEALSKISTGFILDGYPRTISQADFLSTLTNIDAIILVNASKEILVEKTAARRNCKNCGYPWNIADIDKTVDGVHYKLPLFLPKNPNICDHCGKKLELIQRPDDTPKIIEDRLNVYEKQTQPIIEYYRGKVPFVEVWMNKPPEEIVNEIVSGLEKLKLT